MATYRFFISATSSAFAMTILCGHLLADNSEEVISIKNEVGDIYDCVDIYKQPAFEHPDLRNHTIQMIPSKKLEAAQGEKRNNSDPTSSTLVYLEEIKCPAGTVLIPRISTQEPDMGRILASPEHSLHVSRKASQFFGLEFTGLRISGKTFYGASGSVSLYNPEVYSDNQKSSAVIAIENGGDQIEAGWMVNPYRYGDTQTRFFTSWKSRDGSGVTQGCYNVECPGFVLVSDTVPLNYAFPALSVKDKPSVDLHVDITRDPNTGNWWVIMGQAKVGYWPGTIFQGLGGGANVVRFGGEVFTPKGQIHPQMGSGKFENGRYDRTCCFTKMFIVDDRNFPTKPSLYGTIESVESSCYYEADHSDKGDDRGYSFLFGGRGGGSIMSC